MVGFATGVLGAVRAGIAVTACNGPYGRDQHYYWADVTLRPLSSAKSACAIRSLTGAGLEVDASIYSSMRSISSLGLRVPTLGRCIQRRDFQVNVFAIVYPKDLYPNEL